MTKRWWQSKTVLGALAALIATGIRALAPESAVGEGEVLGVLTQVAQTAGAIVAIIGRFKADRRVVSKAVQIRLKIAAASPIMNPPGTVRAGIAAVDIKQGEAVSIDGRGAVRPLAPLGVDERGEVCGGGAFPWPPPGSGQ